MSDIMRTRTVTLDPTAAAFPEGWRVSDLGPTHFIGIGGAGMSVLAEMLSQSGVHVSGSDRQASEKTARLEDAGISVHIGQDPENVRDAAVVVYSSAVKPDNPEILAAADLSVPIVHRSDILDLLMRGKRSVTIAGAHGKTTTSSLIAHILRSSRTPGLADPGYAIGGTIQGPDGTTLDGGHAGTGDVLVAEADESDGSFLKYHPSIAVITNAEADHLDHYGTAEAYHQAFVSYAGHAVDRLVIGVDDEGAREVLGKLDQATAERAVVYTTADADGLGDLRGASVVRIESETESTGSGRERFTVVLPKELVKAEDRDRGDIRIPVALSIPGVHNARNATAAIIVATLLGMDPRAAAAAAETFLGASRRFQRRGEEKGVQVFDDYAHHPTEVAALLHAARRRFPDSRIRVLFQPHLFSRTRFFASDFARALSLADDVIVTGIFPARERQEDYPDVTADTIVAAARGMKNPGAADQDVVVPDATALDATTLDSTALDSTTLDATALDSTDQESASSDRSARGGRPVRGGRERDDSAAWIQAVGDMHLAAQMMAMRAHRGDVIFTVGAGDITDMAPVIIHALQAHRGTCEV